MDVLHVLRGVVDDGEPYGADREAEANQPIRPAARPVTRPAGSRTPLMIAGSASRPVSAVA
ncbi:hypothetical protein SZN_02312 [Streptomyces zinciresistens K42]|uniref:Uncharacterized protein n=1 Tax=Streptomyces zinciresistens K42 TaxID=700597 RepID=G2G4Q9_9ACTN|nr:hypothetical protein [Streptomyces zinciresistens]EGX61532.1 hypothetical protein SZN_02312 [Streptomyces zinciresistens K42]